MWGTGKDGAGWYSGSGNCRDSGVVVELVSGRGGLSDAGMCVFSVTLAACIWSIPKINIIDMD